MWDAVYGALKPHPWLYNITRTQPYAPNFPKIHPHLKSVSGKGAPTCPSIAYQDAKTLCIYIIRMWDAVHGALKPHPWLYNITWTQPSFLQFLKNPPPPSEVYQCMSAPTCPSTASQSAETLCIYIHIYNMDLGCSLWGFEASSMTLQHQLDSAICPQLPKNPTPPSATYISV